MYIKLAWRNIWRNKRRSLITIASILFAVFFAVLARSMQLGMYDRMVANVVEFYSGYIQVHGQGYWDDQNLENSMAADDSLYNLLKAQEGITTVAPRIESFALSAYQDLTKAVKVVGVSPEADQRLLRLNEKLTAGKVLSDAARKAVVSQGLADHYSLHVGDTLYLLGQGYHATNAAGRYPIAGIVDLAQPSLNEGTVFLTISEAQWFFNAPNRLTAYAINLANHRDAPGLKQSLAASIDTAQLEVMTWQEMMPELVQAIQVDSAGGMVMIFILYMVVFFGIFGTIIMMTTERKYEFGVMVAVGMHRWRLALTVLLEVVMLAFLGVLAGLAASWPVALYYHYNPIQMQGEAAQAIIEYGFEPVMPFSIDPAIALSHSAIVLVVAILLALYPLVYIVRLKAIKAMRS